MYYDNVQLLYKQKQCDTMINYTPHATVQTKQCTTQQTVNNANNNL